MAAARKGRNGNFIRIHLMMSCVSACIIGTLRGSNFAMQHDSSALIPHRTERKLCGFASRMMFFNLFSTLKHISLRVNMWDCAQKESTNDERRKLIPNGALQPFCSIKHRYKALVSEVTYSTNLCRPLTNDSNANSFRRIVGAIKMISWQIFDASSASSSAFALPIRIVLF